MQHSQESLRALARRWGINAKTIAKWEAETTQLVTETKNHSWHIPEACSVRTPCDYPRL